MSRVRTNVQQHPIIIVSFDDEYASRFTGELKDAFSAVHVSPLLRTLNASMESLQPSIAIFDLQTIKTEDHSIFEIMASMSETFPHVRKIALGNQNMPTQVISAMKSGACDFLDRNASSQEITDLIAWQMRQVRTTDSSGTGRLYALVSGRENEGENEIAANIAAHMASSRPAGDVLLLDLTLEESQLEIEFNVEVTYSVRNAIDELLRLDKPVLMEVLAKHDSGLCLLPLTTRNGRDDEISPQELATLLGALRNLFSIIIVKAGCLRDRYCRSLLLPHFDKVLLVCPQVIGSISAARDILADDPTESQIRASFGLIVSKYDPAIELSAAQIASRLGIPLLATIPTTWVQLANSHNLGVPLILSSPTNRYSRAIRDLAHQLQSAPMPEVSPETSKSKPRFFGWLDNLKRAAG